MGSNSEVLQKLMYDGAIALEDAPLLRSQPSPLPADQVRDRAEGLLLGLCVGNALAVPTEGLLPTERRAHFGEITEMADFPSYGPAGSMSVDAQLSLRTAVRLLEDGHLERAALAADLAAPGHIVLGDTLARFIERYESGMPWDRSGAPSAGNGALMRIAPMALAHLHEPSPDLWADTAIAGMITHNDGASNSACIAIVRLIWDCLAGDVPATPGAWIKRYLETAAPLEPEDEYKSQSSATPFAGKVSEFVERELPKALSEDLDVFEACARWGSGAYLLETIPSVLYILARHGHSFEEAVLRAVNDTWDNDTIACIVGSVMGAAYGRSGIPERWIKDLSRVGETGRLLERAMSLL